MTQFQYTVVVDDSEIEDLFTDVEYGVGDVVLVARRKFVVERVENTGATNFDKGLHMTLIDKRLHCRPV